MNQRTFNYKDGQKLGENENYNKITKEQIFS
jgi:hypothetical protein